MSGADRKPPATNHPLHAALSDSPGEPAERVRPGAHAGRTAKTLSPPSHSSRATITSYELQATSRFKNPHPNPPRRGGSLLLDARCKPRAFYPLQTKSTSHKLQATGHRPRASFLPPPPGEVAAKPPEGGCWVGVGSGMWEVGTVLSQACRRRHAQFPQAMSHKPRADSKTPTPALPEEEGALFNARCEPRTFCWLWTKSGAVFPLPVDTVRSHGPWGRRQALRGGFSMLPPPQPLSERG